MAITTNLSQASLQQKSNFLCSTLSNGKPVSRAPKTFFIVKQIAQIIFCQPRLVRPMTTQAQLKKLDLFVDKFPLIVGDRLA